MGETALFNAGLVMAGAAIAAFLTRTLQARRHAAAQKRLTQEWSDRIEHQETSIAQLTCQVEAAKRLLAERNAGAQARDKKAKEQQRFIHQLQAKVIDRESTISSLRSRLYGARRSMAILEEEIAEAAGAELGLALGNIDEPESLSLDLR